MKKKIIFFCFASFVISCLNAQSRYADSLLHILQTRNLSLSEQMGVYHLITWSFAAHDMRHTYLYGIKGLELAKKAHDLRMELIFSDFVGSTYTYRTSYDTAIAYQYRQIEIAEKLKEKALLQRTYFGLANIYARQGRFAEAVENYLKSMTFYDDSLLTEWDDSPVRDLANTFKVYVNPHRIYILSLGNTGECYRRLHHYDRALFYLLQGKDMIEREDEGASCKKQIYRELGHVYFDQGDIDNARHYLSEALNAGGLSPVQESDCKEALIKIHILRKEYPKALEYAQDCLLLAKSLGDPYIDVLAWNAFANIYRAQRKYKECEAAAQKAWDIDSTSADTAPISAFNIAYANLALGNYEKAESFFEINDELNRKKNNRQYQDALADQETKYQTQRKEMRILALEQEKKFYAWLGATGIALLLLCIALLFYRHRLNVQKRKLAEQEKALAWQQVRQLEQEKQLIATQAVLDGETAERSRLARDLHDGLGSMLSIVGLKLKELSASSGSRQPDEAYLKAASTVLDESIVELRRLAHHLMPDTLIRFGLRTSLEDFCRSIPIARFQYLGEDRSLDNRLEVMIYRCAYELVNNAVKHSGATVINVQLLTDKAIVSLTVQDNGAGFSPDEIKSGTGLSNIQTRVSAFNGRLTIRSAPGEGAEITIEIEST